MAKTLLTIRIDGGPPTLPEARKWLEQHHIAGSTLVGIETPDARETEQALQPTPQFVVLATDENNECTVMGPFAKSDDALALVHRLSDDPNSGFVGAEWCQVHTPEEVV